MKKFLSLFAAVAVLACAAAGMAFADTRIGLVNMERVISNHPRFEQVTKRIESVMRAKEQEARQAVEKATDKNQAAKIIDTKQREAAQESIKLREPVMREVRLAIRSVSKSKGCGIVIEAGAVIDGGVDLTDAVIAELKKKK